MKKLKKYLSILILVGASFVFFLKINGYPLKNWDEAWYAEVSRNMASGKFGYLMPYWNGDYFFDKPPLYFWLSAPFFKFFGPGEWQARIISGLASVGVLIFLYLIGKKLFNERVGLLSVLIFITFGQIIRRFSEGNLDALLVFTILGSFYFYLKSLNVIARSKVTKQSIYAVLSGIFIGLTVLTKGWIFGLFPIFLILLHSFIFRCFRFKTMLLTTFTMLLTCGWWYILGTLTFGQRFFNWFVFNPAAGGLGNPLGNFSLQYFGYFARDVGLWLLPVAWLLFAVLRNGFADYKKCSKYLLIIIFTLLVSLSFLSEKFDWYILPVYPFTALLAAAGFEFFFCKDSPCIARRILDGSNSLFSGKDAPCKAGCILNKSYLKYLVFSLMFLVNFSWTTYAHSFVQDKSYISADLGKAVKEVIPKGDTVYLDSNDFPAFIYYSGLEKVYVVSDKIPKLEEWWIVGSNKAKEYLVEKGGWLITKTYIEHFNSQTGKQ